LTIQIYCFFILNTKYGLDFKEFNQASTAVTTEPEEVTKKPLETGGKPERYDVVP